MSKLMRQELFTRPCTRRIFTGSKEDIFSKSEGPRAKLASLIPGSTSGVDSYGAEVVPQTGLHSVSKTLR
jgi:hypothetical protein